MDTSRRHYRQGMKPAGFAGFVCKVKETDLQIFVDEESYTPKLVALCEQRILYYRSLLENYIRRDPDFAKTLQPYLAASDAPAIALDMVKAANLAGVGPMAAVAGTFAEYIGRDLLQQAQQVIVENGGDIFMRVLTPARVLVFAGDSPISNKIAVVVPPAPDGLGICTSSGTVGPSLSFGRADAAVILSPCTMLADATATATANLIQSPDDLPTALAFARSIAGITGVILIKDDKMSVWGQVRLATVNH